jgi:hypothetical protein
MRGTVTVQCALGAIGYFNFQRKTPLTMCVPKANIKWAMAPATARRSQFFSLGIQRKYYEGYSREVFEGQISGDIALRGS